MNIFKKIWYAIQASDNDQFLQAIQHRNEQIHILTKDVEVSTEKYNYVLEQYARLVTEFYEYKHQNDTRIELFCTGKYPQIPCPAYKQKRPYGKQQISVYINEFITPHAFEVMKLRETSIHYTVDVYETVQNIGEVIAQKIKWNADQDMHNSLDYYQYPAETLISGRGDCEDHALLVASLHPEIGVCYGFYNTLGHAFNCFIHNNRMYILDTVDDTAFITLYEGQETYKINYIILREKAFAVDDSVVFGELAGW